jgi:hypothetical protein
VLLTQTDRRRLAHLEPGEHAPQPRESMDFGQLFIFSF